MLQVSATGRSVGTATGPQNLLNDSWPLIKLDTTVEESFQTISILFNHEPAQPDPGTFIMDTLLYSYPHPYTYAPSTWMEWQQPAPAYPAAPTSPGGSATTFPAFGDDSAASNGVNGGSATQLSLYADLAYYDASLGEGNYTTAILYTKADTKKVYIYMRKIGLRPNGSGLPQPIFVIGTSVNMRVYVLTEPGTTSTY